MEDHSTGYRPDVDGLRAWAVSLIILFHAKVPGFAGGFIGVDVFFVISGFLITRLIAVDVVRGDFSIARFYERRIKRIIPALSVMVLATLVLGAFLMLPGSYKSLSQSAVATMAFASNILFWRQSANYFAAPTETNPLLHTWSLSVEEQFYLVFPLIFAVLFRRSRGVLIWSCVAIAVLTLVLAELGNQVAPTATFFLSPTRAWEFLGGSLLALNALPKPRGTALATTLTAAGLVLILASGILLRPEAGFPGLLAIPPVAGAMLIILGGDKAHPSLRTIFFTSRPILGIGLISYSLYLWHWPALVFLEHGLLHRELGATDIALAISVSFVLAILSYFYVEQPFRRAGLLRHRRAVFLSGGIATAFLLAFGVVGAVTDGLAFRHPRLAEFAMEEQARAERPFQRAAIENCFFRENGRDACVLAALTDRNVLLWGDSYAQHYTGTLVQLDSGPGGRGIIGMTGPQCPPVLFYDPVNLPDCAASNRQALDLIAEHRVDTAILSARWQSYTDVNRLEFEDIASTVRALKEQGLTVVVVLQTPHFHFSRPDEFYYGEVMRGASDAELARNVIPPGYNAALTRAVEVAGADLVFDAEPLFCSGALCRIHDNGRYLFKDNGHVTLAGAEIIVDALMARLSPLLADLGGAKLKRS